MKHEMGAFKPRYAVHWSKSDTLYSEDLAMKSNPIALAQASFHVFCLVHTLFIIDHSNVVESGAVFLHKGLVNGVLGDIIVPIRCRCKFDHEPMSEPSLQDGQ